MSQKLLQTKNGYGFDVYQWNRPKMPLTAVSLLLVHVDDVDQDYYIEIPLDQFDETIANLQKLRDEAVNGTG